MSKNCGRCGVELSGDNSCPSYIKASWGLCRKCDATYRKERYPKIKGRIQKANKKWIDENKGYYSSQRSQYYRDNPDKKKIASIQTADASRFKKLGVTSQQFNEKISSQNNLCEICKEPMDRTTRTRKPCQDHDHQTGKIRDILCGRCNLFLGHIRESKEILLGAIQYLEKHTDDNLKASSDDKDSTTILTKAAV